MTSRTIVLVEFSPSGGLFQFAVRLGTSLAERGEHVILLTGPDPEIRTSVPGLEIRSVLPTWHPAEGSPDTAWPPGAPGMAGAAGAAVTRAATLARRGTRAARLVAAWVVLAATLARLRPDVVLWSNWRFMFEPLFVVAITRLLPRSTYGIVAHEPLPRSDARDTSTPREGRALRAAFAAAWRRMDIVYVLGTSARREVLENWRPRGEVVVIPHGPVEAFGDHDPGDSAAATGPEILFFGTWTRYKGLEQLLEAFAEVRRAVPDARLVVAGAVSADLDLAAVTSLAHRVGGVDLRPGYVDAADVPEMIRSARVVVTPYLRASQSGVIHLAYTHARPVVSTDVGDLSEAVRDGETGLLVPPGDVSALAGALERLLLDPDLAARLGARGHAELAGTGDEAARLVSEALDRCVTAGSDR